MQSVKNIKEELFNEIRKHKDFQDILTNYYPSNEEQLSAIFGVLFQNGKIDLEKINLYNPNQDGELTSSNAMLSNVVKNDYTLINEFPLFAEKKEEIEIWGGMKIDLAFFNDDAIVLIENKIGSTFTYEGTQLERQLKFLDKLKNFKNKTLIVLSSKKFFNKKWYSSELDKFLKDFNKINGYLICWEDIFKAIK
jgi:hypothetical protein